MGFLKFLSPVAMLFGGDDDEGSSQPAPQPVAEAEDTGKTAEQIQKDKQQKLIATNAGQSTAFNPLANDGDDVTSKSLLGL